MLGVVFATIGGVLKDTVVLTKRAVHTVVDEVSSIPGAFSAGYENGLFTGEDAEHTEPVEQKKPELFSQAA